MAAPLILGLPLLAALLSGVARAQVYVVPRRPGQSIVRYEPHDWQQLDLLVDAELGCGQTGEGDPAKAGGVRLLFYESERASAEIAAARIQQTYRELCDEFDLVPPHRFPYVLYSSYQEFLRTNLFPLQEGVLGVTSPAGLEVTLPYFGDHGRFQEVSRHELAHQFTIQKVRVAMRDQQTWGDPLGGFPLWFIEGLAEFHAHGRVLDEETRVALTDLVVNPDPYRGFALPAFFDDAPYDVLLTYELGYAKVAFLEAAYGAGTTQRLLSESWRMVGGGGRKALHFSELVARITGHEPVVVGARFDAWLKRQLLPAWLDGDLDPGQTLPFVHLDGVIDSLDSSPDGRVLAYRAGERRTGRYRLILVDPDDPGRRKRFARDGRPGSESLHPIDPKSFDLGDDQIAWVAERRGRDTIRVRSWTREERPPRRAERDAAQAEGKEAKPRVKLRLGPVRRYDLVQEDLLAAWTPALSPDGRQVAFVGLGADGRRDLWRLDLDGGGLSRLTDDPYAERELAWGPTPGGGSVVLFTGDRSPDGSIDLFTLDPDDPSTVTRLDPGPDPAEDPAVLPDGTRLFTTIGGERRDVWAWGPQGAERRTDTTTALSDPSPGPGGDWWVLLRDSGRWWPVQVPAAARRPPQVAPAPPAPPDGPWALPRADLSAATDYRATQARNWGLENVFALVGAGGGVVYGQVYLSATDQLRDHAVVLQGAIYGRLDLADASLLYIDQSRRLTWGAGPFSALRLHIDDTFQDEGLTFQGGQRYHGGLVTARWPFDRFLHLQVEQALGSVDSFVFDSTADLLSDGEENGTGRDLLPEWLALYDAPRLQGETTVRLGYDTIGYHAATGPISGWSALLESTTGWQPAHGELFQGLRLDLEGYLPLHRDSGVNLALRGAGGSSWGGHYARSWYLYSPYTLRGVRYGDPDVLLGRHMTFGTAELQVPLDWLVQVAFLNTVEGIVGLDAGAAADQLHGLWDQRVVDVALGTNLVLGPLVFRLHFARALDVGATMPEVDKPWVTNFSLGWMGE